MADAPFALLDALALAGQDGAADGLAHMAAQWVRLEPGMVLGPYRIEEQIGAGGMGEVYRAHDERLGRPVALKVLPRELADDLPRRKRLIREAQAAAALNHPNICTIHEVGQAEGLDYIVFEYIEGRTLRSLSSSGPLSLEQIIDIALALSEALAYAHERGIIHRDLKPSNVMVSTLGLPKILDFGAASYFASPPDADTRERLTQEGVVIGTAGFMSPEQAFGLRLDARSDIFSFGCLLYELAAGQPAFRGRTTVEVTDAVLHSEPARLSQFRPDLPAAFEQILEKSLRKSRDERYQHTSEIALALRALRDKTSTAVTAGRSVSNWRVTALRPRALLIVVFLALATVLFVLSDLGRFDRFTNSRPGNATSVETSFTFEDSNRPAIPTVRDRVDPSVRQTVNVILSATQNVPDNAWPARKQKILEFAVAWMGMLGADANSVRKAEIFVGQMLDEVHKIKLNGERRVYGRQIVDAIFGSAGL